MEKKEDIYQEIGSIVYAIAPDHAEEVIMQAEIKADDVIDFRYSFTDMSGNKEQFSGGGKANYDIFRLLMKLRKEFKTIHEGEWNACTFTLSRSGKFSMDFSYD